MSKEKTILIVEDELPLIKALQIKLVSSSFRIILANNGKVGLSQALTQHPDLILLDLVMPVMDGITMLKKLRHDDWGKKVPVIILTNLSDKEKMTEAEDYGVENYVIKAESSLGNLVKIIHKKLNMQ